MKFKLAFISLFIVSFLIGCSQNPKNLDKDLYDDSLSLLTTLHDIAENADTFDVDDKTVTDMTRYGIKYDEYSEDWTEEEASFIMKTKTVCSTFITYQTDKDVEQLKKFYEALENIQETYDLKL